MASKPTRPTRVAYDISRLTAGGANGGIKVHHYEFLRCFVENHSHELQLHIFCLEEIIPELDFLTLAGNHQIHVFGSRHAYDPRDGDGKFPTLHYWPELPENLLVLLEIDVLYAGFGFSQLFTPAVPQVSLIVDVLHRAYPESLPPNEVAFRDKWYAEELEKATLVQTNSEYCKRQLVDEFAADPDKIFTIGVPVHGRFNRVEMGRLPEQLRGLEHKYYLYPANYWPHKNHQRLIVGFQIYLKRHRPEVQHLVLTGNASQTRQELIETSETLGISHCVHFIGHVSQAQLKAVWENSFGLVFPSNYEGFGIPVLEALYFQKSIVASAIPPIVEIAKDNPFYFDPNNPLSICNALAEASDLGQPRSGPSPLSAYDINREVRVLRETICRVSKSAQTPCD